MGIPTTPLWVNEVGRTAPTAPPHPKACAAPARSRTPAFGSLAAATHPTGNASPGSLAAGAPRVPSTESTTMAPA